MATVNLGRIKPVFRGAYNNSTAYVIDDIVTSGNETFIAIAATQGNATSDASKWTKLAAKGADGTDVGTTLTTQGDILYRDGSGLQRLAKGTAGQVLKINSGATAPEWGTADSGKTLNVVQHTNSTRTSLPTQADYNFFNVTYPQQKANSKILIQAQIPGQGGQAGNVHMKAVYDGTDYDGVGWYAYTDGGHGQILHFFHLINGASTTGNKTLTLKQNSQSGGQRFASTWNPNSSDDNRLGQSVSSLVIIEYDF